MPVPRVHRQGAGVEIPGRRVHAKDAMGQRDELFRRALEGFRGVELKSIANGNSRQKTSIAETAQQNTAPSDSVALALRRIKEIPRLSGAR
jgi:hypothetical protein